MIYKLFKKNAGNPVALEMVSLSTLSAAGWTEKDLEDTLAKRIELVLREDQLMIVAQERKRQEEADILALDQHGVLYIFELKRWQSDTSNLLQVIRYGQIFGQYNYQSLQDLFRKYIKDATGNLVDHHQQYFELAEPLPLDQFNCDQKFIVVTAGIDIKTLEAIRYWRRKNLPITALTYHVYEDGGHFYIEFHSYSPEQDDYVGLLSHDYIVNTNVTYMKDVFKQMLTLSKAAAYYDRKNSVDSIQKGDRVFLYHTGVGIIAVGRALDKAQEIDFEGDTGEEHFVPLKFEIKADPAEERDKCVPAWEINKIAKASYRFRQTAFSISKELGDIIEKLLREKHSRG
jgi:hypothetical protein